MAVVFACISTQAQTTTGKLTHPAVTPNQTPASVQTQATVVDPTAKVLQFKNAEYDFGKITLGKPVSYVVEITNISNDSITLENAHAGCGCTTPNFVPNQKFGPGQTVKVNIGFNGSVQGAFTRFTDISFSGGLTKQTRFTGEGIPEAKSAESAGTAAPEKAKIIKN